MTKVNRGALLRYELCPLAESWRHLGAPSALRSFDIFIRVLSRASDEPPEEFLEIGAGDDGSICLEMQQNHGISDEWVRLWVDFEPDGGVRTMTAFGDRLRLERHFPEYCNDVQGAIFAQMVSIGVIRLSADKAAFVCAGECLDGWDTGVRGDE